MSPQHLYFRWLHLWWRNLFWPSPMSLWWPFSPLTNVIFSCSVCTTSYHLLINLLSFSEMYLNNNMLEGRILKSLVLLHSLGVLDMAYNNITGPIPLRIYMMLNSLVFLYLAWNKLDKKIPSCICNRERIYYWNLIPTAAHSSRMAELNVDGKYKGLLEQQSPASDLHATFRT